MIEYRPWRKIVIHELCELSPKDFFTGLAEAAEAEKAGGIPLVDWAGGVAFTFNSMTNCKKALDDKVEGILHYSLVTFTRVGFEPEKRVTVQGRDHTVKVRNCENNPDFVNLAEFLIARKPLEILA